MSDRTRGVVLALAAAAVILLVGAVLWLAPGAFAGLFGWLMRRA